MRSRDSAGTLSIWLATAALSSYCIQSASAASFPCEKAKSKVELAICASPKLSELDDYLSRYYAAARMALRHAEDCLVSDQRSWIQLTRNQCKDADCLKQAYLSRLSALHAVQPGATSLRTLDLPAGPSLVWIIPSAADQVAAPRAPQGAPLVLSGRILNEVTSGDGYVLEATDGRKRLIAPLMFLEATTTDALAQLSKDMTVQYEVRGRIEANPGQTVGFSLSHCTYVYRSTQ
jgi:uncharacterized protein